MNTREKLHAMAIRFGGTQEKLARKIGVSKDTIRSWIQRDAIPDKSIHKILDNLPEINPRWLLEDEEPMMLDGPRLMTNIFATAGRVEQFNDMNEESVPFHVPGVNADGFLKVSGFSMKPTINEGDIIGVKEVAGFDVVASRKTIYMVITQDNERMVKHISEIDEEYMTLTSDNPDYEPFRVHRANVVKIFRVVWHGSEV